MKTIIRKIVLPDWVTWMAQDGMGDWHGYEFIPVPNEAIEEWDVPDGQHVRLYEGPVICNWRKTLRRI